MLHRADLKKEVLSDTPHYANQCDIKAKKKKIFFDSTQCHIVPSCDSTLCCIAQSQFSRLGYLLIFLHIYYTINDQ
jgi:hypothetical protein